MDHMDFTNAPIPLQWKIKRVLATKAARKALALVTDLYMLSPRDRLQEQQTEQAGEWLMRALDDLEAIEDRLDEQDDVQEARQEADFCERTFCRFEYLPEQGGGRGLP